MDPHFEGVIFQTHAAELARRIRRAHPPFAILDVRPASDFRSGHIPGARSIEPQALASGLPDGVAQGTEVFVVGRAPGDPAVRATSMLLRGHGVHRRVELTGGMHEWRSLRLPLEAEARVA